MRMSNTEKAGQSHHWDKTWPEKKTTMKSTFFPFVWMLNFSLMRPILHGLSRYMEFNLAMTSLQNDDKVISFWPAVAQMHWLVRLLSVYALMCCPSFCFFSPFFFLFIFSFSSVQFLVFQGWVPRLVKLSGVMSWWRWSCCSDGIKVLHKSFQVGHLFGQLIRFIILWEMYRVIDKITCSL